MNPDSPTLPPSCPDNRSQRLDEVVTAYVKASETGSAPDPAEWLARYPEFASELNTFFAAQTEVSYLAAPLRAPLEMVRYFGDYELLEEIARGGMGVVYRARQVSLNRIVALKMIKEGQLASAEDVARFRAEAEAASKLDHPNILPVYEIGLHNGLHYFSMKLIEAGSLAGRIPELMKQPREAVRCLVLVARAVHHAHQHGILHRDLKPANVLLGADGQPHVTDFGLAKRTDGDSGLTQSGAIIGTPSYMAPEQAAARKDLTTAIDVYALGAILYELLTGQAPFRGETPVDTILAVLEKEPVAPRSLQPRVDRDLETIALKCLHKEPRQRYGSAEALAEDLERWMTGEPILARPVGTLERAVKWARRRPAVAGLLAAIVVLTVTALGAILGLYGNAVREAKRAQEAEGQAELDRDAAQEQERLARKAEKTAREQKERAEKQLDRAERLVYASQIQSAHRAWQAGDVAQAWTHLNSCRWDYRGPEHHYLFTLFNHNHVTLEGHSGGVHCVAISPDASFLVSGGADKMVKVWDPGTGKERFSLHGHAGQVLSVAISSDASCIVSGSVDGTLKVWDARTGEELFSLQADWGVVTGVAFSPDGSRIVSGHAGISGHDSRGFGIVKVWDVRTHKQLLLLKGGDSGVSSVAISGDGSRIVCAGSEGTVKVWDAHSGKELRSLKGHEVAFIHNGSRIVTRDPFDNSLKVWDTHSGKELHSLHGRTQSVGSLAFSPDGSRIASGSLSRTVEVWDAHSGKALLSLQGHTAWVTSVAFSSDGMRIVSGSKDGIVKVWGTRNDKESSALQDRWRPFDSLAYSLTTSRIVTGSLDGTVKVWDGLGSKPRLSFKAGEWPLHVAISPDGERIVTGDNMATVKVWDAGNGKDLFTLRKGPVGGLGCPVAYSPDGSRIACGVGSIVETWDARSCKRLLSLAGPPSGVSSAWPPRVSSVAISGDGSRIVACMNEGPGRVWDAHNGKELFSITGQDVAISTDGSRIVSGDNRDKTVRVWDARSGKELHSLQGQMDQLGGVAISSDGRRIVTGSGDRMVKVWDAVSGAELLSLPGHTEAVCSVAIAQDGSRIVSRSVDGTVRVWDTSSTQELLELQGGTTVIGRATTVDVSGGVRGTAGNGLPQGTTVIRRVAFTRDGTQILGQDARGNVLAWSAVTGQPLPDPPAHLPAGAGEQATSPDGRLRVLVRDGGVRVLVLSELQRARLRDRQRLEQLARFDPAWHRGQFDDALRAGDDFAAAFHLERLARHQPWDASLHVYLAHVHARQGKRPEAALHLAQALLLEPRVSLWPIDPGAAQRGEEAARAGVWPRAVRELQLAAQQPRAPLSCLTDLLVAQRAARDEAGARQTMADLAGLLPRTKGPLAVDVIDVAVSVPWGKEVAASFLEFTRQNLDRQRNAGTLYIHGAALYRAGQYALAEQTLRESIQVQGEGGDPRTLPFLALVAELRGKHEEALRLLTRLEQLLRQQPLGNWQQREWWNALLAEARQLILTPVAKP